MQNQWQTQKHRNGGLILEKHRLNWDALDRYVKLLNFQLEVTSIYETRAYEVSDEERIPVIKNWLGWKGLLLKGTFTQKKKKNVKLQRDCSRC